MKGRTIGYWATTGLLSFMMLGAGVSKLTAVEDIAANMQRIGFPDYMMTILGAWYLAAAVALLIPGMPRIKEWAYAGITFAMTGAFASHMFMNDPVAGSAPIVVILGLTAASYVLRPGSRRLDAVSEAAAPSAAPQPAAAK